MSASEKSVVDSVQETASKISEIFSSFVDSGKSVLMSPCHSNKNEKNGSVSASFPKTQSHSQEAFYKRVSTFQPGLWTVRGLSPLECARWGWKLIEKDALQCVSCHEVICALLPSTKDKVAYERFFSILKDRLETNHKEACGWLYDPSPQEFVEPLHIDTTEELKNLINSANTLSSLNSALPYINNNRIMAVLGADNEMISGIGKDVSCDENVKSTSVLLVLSGWSKGQGSYLTCTVCRRQVGLWSYISMADELKKVESTVGSSDSSNSRKRKLLEQEYDHTVQDNSDGKRVIRQSPKKMKLNQRLESNEKEHQEKGSDKKDDDDEENIDSDNHSSTEMDVQNNGCLLITSLSTQVEEAVKQYFHPLEEHRYWCPWIAVINDRECSAGGDTGSVDDGDRPKGFCIITEQVRAVLQISKHSQRRSSEKVENVEGLRKIRSLLDEVS